MLEGMVGFKERLATRSRKLGVEVIHVDVGAMMLCDDWVYVVHVEFRDNKNGEKHRVRVHVSEEEVLLLNLNSSILIVDKLITSLSTLLPTADKPKLRIVK